MTIKKIGNIQKHLTIKDILVTYFISSIDRNDQKGVIMIPNNRMKDQKYNHSLPWNFGIKSTIKVYINEDTINSKPLHPIILQKILLNSLGSSLFLTTCLTLDKSKPHSLTT